VAKPQIFDGILSKVSSFITAYKLYLRIMMEEITVEEQIQWVLSYIQEGSTDIWKKNILEDLEGGILEYKTAGKFMVDIKKEFGREDEEAVKAAELKRIEQGGKTMEEFVQEFKRVTRGSRYEERLLVEEFKREINGVIHQRFMESECQPSSIEQWYDKAIVLDRN